MELYSPEQNAPQIESQSARESKENPPNRGRQEPASRDRGAALSGRIPREKYASGFHIPELIERAYITGDATNYHADKVSDIPTYEYYDSPIEIDGRSFTAHIRVRNTMSGDKYYGHTISEVDEIRIEPSSARTSADGTSTVQPVDKAGDSSVNIIFDSPENVNGSVGDMGAKPAMGAADYGFSFGVCFPFAFILLRFCLAHLCHLLRKQGYY